jgi:hypothetical protein
VRSLFQANPLPFAGGSNYDVTCDGRKSVVASLAPSDESEPLTVIVNWTTLLKQKYCSQRAQNPHLYEAILLVNRGVDEAVRGLERLKRAKDSQLDSSCFAEELVVFEDHRARLNSYFCGALQRTELQDSARFGTRHREYEKKTLDEVQVYHDVQVVENRRRAEGQPPKVRFFTQEEQQEWERQYPQASPDVKNEPNLARVERT